MTNKTIWNDRWYYSLEPAIIQSRQKIEKQIKKNKKITSQTRDALTTIAATLEGLRRFGGALVQLFSDLFKKAPEILIPDEFRYPKEWVMRTTLDQIAFDLEVLQRAANQRLEKTIGPASAKTLQLADQYAYHHVLQPAIDANYIQETTVITYFQKSANVRVIPYAPVALIGIPFTTLNVSRQASSEQQLSPQLGKNPYLQSLGIFDFGAIAHEIGHYVYRHGDVPNNGDGPINKTSIHRACNEIKDEIKKYQAEFFAEIEQTTLAASKGLSEIEKEFLCEYTKLSNNLSSESENNRSTKIEDLPTATNIKNLSLSIQEACVPNLGKWMQEIFADVYGCLIAGNSITFAFIELQIDNDPKEIVKDDGYHPPTIIRPLTYFTVLEKMGYTKDSDMLRALWNEWLTRHQIGEPCEFLLDSLDKLVDSMLTNLNFYQFGDRLPKPNRGNECESELTTPAKPTQLLSMQELNKNVDEAVLAETFNEMPQATKNVLADIEKSHNLTATLSNRSTYGDYHFERKLRIINKNVKDLLHNDISKIIRISHRHTPTLKLNNNSKHTQSCEWELVLHDLAIRDGAFWHSDPATKNIMPGTIIGPKYVAEPDSGMQKFVNLANNKNEKVPPSIWKYIFQMNGWATGGPEVNGADPESGG